MSQSPLPLFYLSLSLHTLMQTQPLGPPKWRKIIGELPHSTPTHKMVVYEGDLHYCYV